MRRNPYRPVFLKVAGGHSPDGGMCPEALVFLSARARTAFIPASGGLDHQLFVSRYLVALPKPEQLEQLIETDRTAWEQHHSDPSPTGDQP